MNQHRIYQSTLIVLLFAALVFSPLTGQNVAGKGGQDWASSQQSEEPGPAQFQEVLDPERWLPMATAGAPTGRVQHTAVWTGKEMIIWGGLPDFGTGLNNGGRYDPGQNKWSSMAAAPIPARKNHTAVWTGSEMIVWGGEGASPEKGARYDPLTNTWKLVSTTGSPAARWGHLAVWTGSEMIVWGGWSGTTYLNTGGRYNPTTNTWKSLPTINAPSARSGAAVVWSGAELIIWGGWDGSNYLNSGFRYNPATNIWAPLPTSGAPSKRSGSTAVWTGTGMIVWGGSMSTGNLPGDIIQYNDGAYYHRATNTWSALPDTPLEGRSNYSVVWTGRDMIIWGGARILPGGLDYRGSGVRYSPITNLWRNSAFLGEPARRYCHTAVWTGRQMIIWGGTGFDNYFSNGGRFEPYLSTHIPMVRK